jgi:hypothetical protein
MEVILINNPLKVIKIKGTFKDPEEQNYNNTNSLEIVTSYMDLSKGVWNLSLDTYALKSNDDSKHLDCVLEVSTNFVSSFEYTKNTQSYQSTPAILGHMSGFGTLKTFDHFEKKWFTLENAGTGNMFSLYLKQNEIFKKTPVNLNYELTILFQRIK